MEPATIDVVDIWMRIMISIVMDIIMDMRIFITSLGPIVCQSTAASIIALALLIQKAALIFEDIRELVMKMEL